jgi:hypothetical protein
MGGHNGSKRDYGILIDVERATMPVLVRRNTGRIRAKIKEGKSMVKSKTPKTKVKMLPVSDHFNYRFLNRAMRSFYSMGFVLLIRSTEYKVNIFRLAESTDRC